jgi:hypothetical protein
MPDFKRRTWRLYGSIGIFEQRGGRLPLLTTDYSYEALRADRRYTDLSGVWDYNRKSMPYRRK